MNKRFVTATVAFLFGTYLLAQSPSNKPPSTEDRLQHLSERLDKDLQLKPDQKQKVLDAFKDFFTKVDAVADKTPPPPPPPPPPVNKEQMDKLIQERDSKLKSILSDDQFQKFQEMERNMHHGPRPGKDGPPPPPRPTTI